jgi:hypothetical protein
MDRESFVLPRTGQTEVTVDAKCLTPAAIESARAALAPPNEPVRRINWNRVLGLAMVLVVSVAAWATIAIAVSHLWR